VRLISGASLRPFALQRKTSKAYLKKPAQTMRSKIQPTMPGINRTMTCATARATIVDSAAICSG
jgi:hypothetical protein